MTDQTLKEYVDFMYDRNNEKSCDNCPENRGFDGWGSNMPCGQQNCWVSCHCAENDDD